MYCKYCFSLVLVLVLVFVANCFGRTVSDTERTNVVSVRMSPEVRVRRFDSYTNRTVLSNGGYEERGLRHGEKNKHKKKKKEGGLIEKILPMMVVPFMVQSSMIPMMMVSLKVMLLKTLLIGKLALILLAINALWRLDNRGGGVYSHNVNLDPELMKSHYGYTGGEEYGAYLNKRRRKK